MVAKRIAPITFTLTLENGETYPVRVTFSNDHLPNVVLKAGDEKMWTGRLTREFWQAMGDVSLHLVLPRRRVTVSIDIADQLLISAALRNGARPLAEQLFAALKGE